MKINFLVNSYYPYRQNKFLYEFGNFPIMKVYFGSPLYHKNLFRFWEIEHINFLAVDPTMTVTAVNTAGGTTTAAFDATPVDCLGIDTLVINYRAGKPLSDNVRVLIQPYLPDNPVDTDDFNWLVTPVPSEGFDLVLTLDPADGITEFGFAYFVI